MLFVNVAEQVEWLDADVGSVQATLQETPEVFHSVGVNVSVHVFDRVIDDSVPVVGLKPVIGFQFIGEDCRASFDVLTNLRLKFLLASAIRLRRRVHCRRAPSFP